jgi:hypothetical protein
VKEPIMPARHQDHLQIVRLSHDLHRLAEGFQLDGNASRFLVHQTLMTAFATPAGARSPADRESGMRRDMAARLHAFPSAPARSGASATV